MASHWLRIRRPENAPRGQMSGFQPSAYFQFVDLYRRSLQVPLGGTRYLPPNASRQSETSMVLSVGLLDSRSSVPFRAPLSTFGTGQPITSYGCLIRWSDQAQSDEDEYLLVRRTDTVEYGDLIRGCYRESQFYFLLAGLSSNERDRLIRYRTQFDVLWQDLYDNTHHGDLYAHSSSMFNRIAPHFETFFAAVPSADPDGRRCWGFPKGRIQYLDSVLQESPWSCALRELTEETRLTLDRFGSLDPLLSDPIEELHFGSNSKNYSSQYFVLQASQRPPPEQFPRRQTPIREVSVGESDSILWVRASQLDQYLPPDRLSLIPILTGLRSPVEVNPIWTSTAWPPDL